MPKRTASPFRRSTPLVIAAETPQRSRKERIPVGACPGQNSQTSVAGSLPAATRSNVGIYGTGQAYESLLLRMRAHPLVEMRDCADVMLTELRKVVPAFFTRVDQPDRGGRFGGDAVSGPCSNAAGKGASRQP